MNLGLHGCFQNFYVCRYICVLVLQHIELYVEIYLSSV
jgi:hypothetical protein